MHYPIYQYGLDHLLAQKARANSSSAFTLCGFNDYFSFEDFYIPAAATRDINIRDCTQYILFTKEEAEEFFAFPSFLIFVFPIPFHTEVATASPSLRKIFIDPVLWSFRFARNGSAFWHQRWQGSGIPCGDVIGCRTRHLCRTTPTENLCPSLLRL